ncbi:myosin-16 [Oryzias melastigma]|uniref:myosin-16 n=1 Tax=Oryzias melastigma TaxID=30732 RepID=UPI000CF7C441|nr:myosin-16 [Oryzias melastigma]
MSLPRSIDSVVEETSLQQNFSMIENKVQEITLLTSELKTLTAELEGKKHLKEVFAGVKQAKKIASEFAKELEKELQDVSKKLQEQNRLEDCCKEQQQKLYLLTKANTNLKATLLELQTRVRDPQELSSELEKAKLTAKSLIQDNQDLLKEVQRVRTSIMALEPQEKQLKMERDLLQSEKEKNFQQTQDLIKEMEEFEEKLKHLAELEDKVAATKADHETVMDQKDALISKLKSTRRKHYIARGEFRAQFRVTPEVLEEKNKKETERIQSQRDHNAVLNQLCSELERKDAEVTRQISSLQNDKNDLEREVRRLKQQIRELSQHRQDSRPMADSVVEGTSLQQNFSMIENKVQEMTSPTSQLQTLTAEPEGKRHLKETYAGLKQGKKSASKIAKQLEKDLQHVSKKLQDQKPLEDCCKEQQQKIHVLTETNTNLKATLQELQTRVRDPQELSSELEKAKLTAKSLSQENQDLLKEVQRVQTSIMALEPEEKLVEVERDRLKTLQEKNAVLQSQLQDLQRHCEKDAATKQRHASILDQTKSLEHQNSILDSEILQLTLQCEEAKHWVQQLHQITTNLDGLQQTNADLTEKRDHLKKEQEQLLKLQPEYLQAKENSLNWEEKNEKLAIELMFLQESFKNEQQLLLKIQQEDVQAKENSLNLEKKNEKLAKELKVRRENFEKKQEQRLQLGGQRDQNLFKYLKLEQENQALVKEIEEFEGKLKHLNELEGKVTATKAELKTLMDRRQSLNSMLFSTRLEYYLVRGEHRAKFRCTAEILEQKTRKDAETIQLLRDQTSVLNELYVELYRKDTEVTRQISSLQNDKKALESEVQRLKQQNEELSQQPQDSRPMAEYLAAIDKVSKHEQEPAHTESPPPLQAPFTTATGHTPAPKASQPVLEEPSKIRENTNRFQQYRGALGNHLGARPKTNKKKN